MSVQLDYTKLSTWESIGATGVFRLASDDGKGCDGDGCVIGAVHVFAEAMKFFNMDFKKLAPFNLNCEKLALRGSQLHVAYKHHCNLDISKLVKRVLNMDESLKKDIPVVQTKQFVDDLADDSEKTGEATTTTTTTTESKNDKKVDVNEKKT